MKRILQTLFALFAFVSLSYAEGLAPSAMTIYRIENLSNDKFLSNGNNVKNDARIVFETGNAANAQYPPSAAKIPAIF